MPNDEGNPEEEIVRLLQGKLERYCQAVRILGFGILSSFGIRHSSFSP
jgi:hypothetical protein